MICGRCHVEDGPGIGAQCFLCFPPKPEERCYSAYLKQTEKWNARDKGMIVLVTGLKRSGKGEMANALQSEFERLSYRVMRLSFAEELRSHLEILNPAVAVIRTTPDSNPQNDLIEVLHWRDAIEQYGYERAKATFPEMRRLMQTYGTEVIRQKVDGNFWAEAALERVEDFLELPDLPSKRVAIIDDCRFCNEWTTFCTQPNVHLIQVIRPPQEDADPHSSEDQTWVGCVAKRITVKNNKTLARLRINTVEIVKRLVKEPAHV